MFDSDSLTTKIEKSKTDKNFLPKLVSMNHSISFLNYQKYFLNKEDENLLSEESYEIFGNFNDGNIFYTIENVINEIETTDLIDLIRNPPENVKKFLTLYQNYVSDINFESLAFNWPPPFNYKSIFPMHTKKLHFLLIKMVQMTSFPQKMLHFFMICLVNNKIQTQFTTIEEKKAKEKMNKNKKQSNENQNQQKSLQENKNIYAVCLLSNQPNITYAILNKDKFLHILQLSNQEEITKFRTIFKERISRVKYIRDENSLYFYNSVGQFLTMFPLKDDELCIKWSQVYFKNNQSHLFSFLKNIVEPIPNIIYKGVYQTFLDLDMLVVHALCTPGVVKPSYYNELSKCLIQIGTYQNRLIYYLNSIFSTVFESDIATVDYLCSDECILPYISYNIAIQTETKYKNLFISKLCNYIEEEDQIINPFQNKERLTVVFFTVMKYILDSFDFLSNNFKYLCSMLSSYIILKFNSTEAVIRIISSFFISFVCKFLEDRNNSLKHPNKNYKEIIKLIKLSFSYQKLVPKYQLDSWEERFYHHLYPHVAKFSLSLCNIHGQITLEIPTIQSIYESLKQIIKIVSENNKKISQRIEDLKMKQETQIYSGKTTATSWCFAINISMHFMRLYEKQNSPVLYAPAFPLIFFLNQRINLPDIREPTEGEALDEDQHKQIELINYLKENTKYTESKTKNEIIENSTYEKKLFNQKHDFSYIFNKFYYKQCDEDVLEIIPDNEEESISSRKHEINQEEEDKIQSSDENSQNSDSY